MRRLRQWLRRDDDAGFGLVEMVVALLIAGLVFSALATTLIAAVKTSLLSRQNQQAADFMTQAIEDMRLQDFGSLSVDPAGLAGGPALLGSCSGSPCAQIDGTYANLVIPSGASIAGVTATSTFKGDGTAGQKHTNETTFTLYRYVTEVAGQQASAVRRVTVYITWQLNGAMHQRSSSTVISYSQRGLPLPFFSLKDSTGGVCVNPSATAVHAFTLENKGAPDRWNITLSYGGLALDPTDATAFKLYRDTDNNGIYSAGDTVQLTDTNGDGIVDTGRLDPGTKILFFLVRPTLATTPLGAHNVTVTATSVGQPSATTATQSVGALTSVQTGVCTSPTPSPSPTPTVSPTPTPTPTPTSTLPADPICTPVSPITVPTSPAGFTSTSYYLRNNGLLSSAIQTQLNFNTSSPSFTSLGAYSTDVASTIPGRVVSPPAGAVTDGNSLRALTDQKTFIDWSRDFASTQFSGDGVLRLWVAAGSVGAVPAGTLHVAVYGTKSNGSLDQELAYADVAISSSCTGFQEIGVPLHVAAYTAKGSSRTLHVRISSSSAVRFAYDTTVMPAALVVNVK